MYNEVRRSNEYDLELIRKKYLEFCDKQKVNLLRKMEIWAVFADKYQD